MAETLALTKAAVVTLILGALVVQVYVEFRTGYKEIIMAHFAELDENNNVLRVVVVDNKDTSDVNGNEVESIGVAYLENLLGGKWLQTSYNNKIRGQYAGQGMKYDSVIDRFYPAQPTEFPSWKLNKITWLWETPEPYPNDGKRYTWNEEIDNWEEINF
jgi:hypothetical protein